MNPDRDNLEGKCIDCVHSTSTEGRQIYCLKWEKTFATIDVCNLFKEG